MQNAKPRLVLLITEDFYLWSHRLHVARAARDAGLDVHVVTRIRDYEKLLKEEGFTLVPIPFLRRGRQPVGELYGVLKLAQLYRRLKPDIVHHVAMKPVLYGSWAARLAGVPAVVNAVAGLGYGFIAEGWQARVLRAGLRTGLRSALALSNSKVIFQNREDFERMVREKVVRRERVVLIRGAGVDLTKYTPSEERPGVPMVVYGGRMLWHKGIKEFADAARLLKQRHIPARFVLVGKTDPDNPDSLSEDQLLSYEKEGIIEWWGHREDIPEILSGAHVVVLPSYTEGLPKILLEACACARAVVACANAGCREIVRDGENGFLVPPKDAVALARAITDLLRDAGLRERMGKRGRDIVMNEFSVEQVARQTLEVYDEHLPQAGRASFGVKNYQAAIEAGKSA
jgi:glycosyltransferase involved in cell wall biosynthesis